MITELVQSIAWLIAVLFLALIFCMTIISIFLRIKRKFIDLFGHELKNSDANVRKAYVMKSNDDEVLKKVALDEYVQDIGVEAVSRINSKSALEEISKSGRFRVSRAAKRKIKELY